MATAANHAYCRAEHNYTMLQAFEWYVEGGGVFLKQLTAQLPELAKMGITAMWLPPITKADGRGEYDAKANLRTKYGTKEELLDAVRTGKELGILTYIDAVLNHKFGADETQVFQASEVDWDDRNHDRTGLYDIRGWTGFNFPARIGKESSKSDFKWNFNHFSGVDADANNPDHRAIFRIHGQGKSWPQRVDKEKGNYAYLMGADLDHAHPEVSDDLINWGTWIMDELDAGGFRFDAIKHIDEGFLASFVKKVREKTGKSEMFCVGEYWKNDMGSLDSYLSGFGAQFSVFDTPLHYNFQKAGDMGSSYDLRRIWDGTVVNKRPIDAVTIVDNHDTWAHPVLDDKQLGQQLQSWVAPSFKPLAYAMILLRNVGYPCVFYGDLYGCRGGDGVGPQQPVSQLADFIKARKFYAYGEVQDYWDHMNCVGWVRTGNKVFDGCAVIMCNGTQPGTKWMAVGKEHAGEKWTDLLGWRQGEVIIDKDGWAEFSCHAPSVSIWVHEKAKRRGQFAKRR